MSGGIFAAGELADPAAVGQIFERRQGRRHLAQQRSQAFQLRREFFPRFFVAFLDPRDLLAFLLNARQVRSQLGVLCLQAGLRSFGLRSSL